MNSLYATIDPYLIWLYRLTGFTFADFLIGTFLIALLAVMVGELTISLAYLASSKRIEAATAEVVRYQNLSVDAVAAGDKTAYHAANKMANDAFGKQFFLQISLAAAMYYPIPFALGWMQSRFSEVEFPVLFTEYTVGFACVFIALYAAAYLLFRRVKCRIGFLRRIKDIIDQHQKAMKGMKSFSDLIPAGQNR